MKIAVIDIETDAVNATKIHCIVTREVDSSDHKVWLYPFTDFKTYSKTVDLWVAHNGISFDIPVLNRLINAGIELRRVVDTFIVSRLVNYSSYNTHSLDEIGATLGLRKKPFTDFSKLTDEMIEYCKQDVDVNLRIYKKYSKYIWDDTWSKSLRVEHDIAVVCHDMQKNGFHFDRTRAQELLSSITERMQTLEALFQKQWPPQLTEVNRIKYRMKADGTLFKNVQESLSSYPKTVIEGNELVCYDYKAFNPGSPKDRVEKLWQAGWEPTEKTKTHYEFGRDGAPGKMWGKTKLTKELYDEKKKHFEFYGWTVSEENLLTLPENAPEGATKLAEWLTLEGRRSSLVEWLGQCKEDSRIHGKFWHIGAWTHRMSHSSPNSANISSAFHGEPRNGVENVKKEFDGQLRALWGTPEGSWLVGTDASGIQLRILCHYMKSEEYRKAILSGKKEEGTDIHSLNMKALGPVCRDRDTAKTFVYAWLLGAGNQKIARILNCSTSQAKNAVENFLDALQGLRKLKTGLIPRDAARGYFDGLDGRKVLCNSEHLMLAGYLQNGEAVATKMWILEWRRLCKENGLWFKHVNYVHDEVQVEVKSEVDAETLITYQKMAITSVNKSLNMFCPLDIESNIGKTWFDTH